MTALDRALLLWSCALPAAALVWLCGSCGAGTSVFVLGGSACLQRAARRQSTSVSSARGTRILVLRFLFNLTDAHVCCFGCIGWLAPVCGLAGSPVCTGCGCCVGWSLLPRALLHAHARQNTRKDGASGNPSARSVARRSQESPRGWRFSLSPPPPPPPPARPSHRRWTCTDGGALYISPVFDAGLRERFHFKGPTGPLARKLFRRSIVADIVSALICPL